jgi:hypothetical protein
MEVDCKRVIEEQVFPVTELHRLFALQGSSCCAGAPIHFCTLDLVMGKTSTITPCPSTTTSRYCLPDGFGGIRVYLATNSRADEGHEYAFGAAQGRLGRVNLEVV